MTRWPICLSGLALLLAGCGDDKGAYQTALQSYLDARPRCVDIGQEIALPATLRLAPDGGVTRYETVVLSYDDPDALPKRLQRLEEIGLVKVEAITRSDLPLPALDHPSRQRIRFSIALKPAPAFAGRVGADGRGLCTARRVEATLSLGDIYKEQGESFRKGRYRIGETPPLPPTLGDVLLGSVTGEVEVIFRDASPPVVVAITRNGVAIADAAAVPKAVTSAGPPAASPKEMILPMTPRDIPGRPVCPAEAALFPDAPRSEADFVRRYPEYAAADRVSIDAARLNAAALNKVAGIKAADPSTDGRSDRSLTGRALLDMGLLNHTPGACQSTKFNELLTFFEAQRAAYGQYRNQPDSEVRALKAGLSAVFAQRTARGG
ncbi:hypothetical protein J5J86_21415 [Aquabacter sp. L1I39]|uniref:hypothetical protein n=1 Tax=Aquabacter sp. L1I39 TaxID=2820278 RepID=UPI001ADAB3BF|nr:hypothetical protein [Aquabacter sp. L1I39]QTL03275.1 hypothetical protein J5J86_21415 [Aquabacter sp. L1I39]